MEIKNLKLKNFVFFGTPNFAKIVLEILVKNEYKPDLVITSPDKPVGRKQILTPSPVKQFASENNLYVETPTNKNNLINIFVGAHHGVPQGAGTAPLQFGVLAAYGLILPQNIIQSFPHGILNIHPSLLPRYRGSSPIQTAILNGDAETGVTIIKLNEKIDEGEIVAQEKVQILPNDTTLTLGEKLFTIGTNLLIKILPDYLNHKIVLTKQNQTHYHLLKDDSASTRKFSKKDGYISLEEMQHAIQGNIELSKQIESKFRAFTPWPGIWTTLPNGKRLLITKCHLEQDVLKIDFVKIEGYHVETHYYASILK